MSELLDVYAATMRDLRLYRVCHLKLLNFFCQLNDTAGYSPGDIFNSYAIPEVLGTKGGP